MQWKESHDTHWLLLVSRPVLDVQPHLISAMTWEHNRDVLIVGRFDGSLGLLHVVESSRGIVIDRKELEFSRREGSKLIFHIMYCTLQFVLFVLVPASSMSCSTKQPMLAVGYEDGVVCILLSDGETTGSATVSQYVMGCQLQADQVVSIVRYEL